MNNVPNSTKEWKFICDSFPLCRFPALLLRKNCQWRFVRILHCALVTIKRPDRVIDSP